MKRLFALTLTFSRWMIKTSENYYLSSMGSASQPATDSTKKKLCVVLKNFSAWSLKCHKNITMSNTHVLPLSITHLWAFTSTLYTRRRIQVCWFSTVIIKHSSLVQFFQRGKPSNVKVHTFKSKNLGYHSFEICKKAGGP